MSVNWTDKDLGVVSAFGVAKEHGWTGTEAEWEALQAAAPQAGSDAEAYGAGTRSGTAVGSTDPAYQNNAKYYKEQAAGSASSAAASAADALEHTQGVIEGWLEENIDPATGYALDRTLTQSNAAAPADITGDLKSVYDTEKVSSIVCWEQGGIDEEGSPTTSNSRIRTNNYIDLTDAICIKISPATDYWFAINLYDITGTFISSSASWEKIAKEFWRNDLGNNAAFMRIVLRKSDNGSISPSDNTNITISFVNNHDRKRLDDIDKNVYSGTKYYTGLENGTIINTSNTNAVHTRKVPCKQGDIVEFVPVRPNTNGYYYLYGFNVYDATGTTIDYETVAKDYWKKINVNYENAAFISFFVVEYNGSQYSQLRKTTYGYTPYIRVNYEDTLYNRAIKDADLLENVAWEQGGIDEEGRKTSNDARIRTEQIEIGYVDKVTIKIASGFSYARQYYDVKKEFISGDTSWQTGEKSIRKSNMPKDTGYIIFVVRKTSGNISPSEHGCLSVEYSAVAGDGIEFVSNKIDTVIPTYDKYHYRDLIRQARFSPTSGAKVLTLLHFSDVHDDLPAMLKAQEIKKDFSNLLNDVIHTGDVVLANYSNGLDNWINSGCAQNVISVIGNHDSEENLTIGTAGKENVYAGMLAPYIGNWNAVQPEGVNDPGSPYYCSCFYYKDYTSQSIRLIVLDTNWWDTYQKEWLADVLDDALTNEYSVILAAHTPRFITGVTEANFCSYTEPIISESASYATISNDWLDPVDDFIDAGGEVICMLSGHNHRDHFGYLTNYPRVLCITADKASIARTIDTARIRGENNETAFNIIAFNTTDKWIKIVRIGAEVDGQMRGKHVFCYDYANKRIISQW